jgi:hypothetical protein
MNRRFLHLSVVFFHPTSNLKLLLRLELRGQALKQNCGFLPSLTALALALPLNNLRQMTSFHAQSLGKEVWHRKILSSFLLWYLMSLT